MRRFIWGVTVALLLVLSPLQGVHAEDVPPPPAESEPSRMRDGEKFSFQAEVSRLMDIIIHSLYSNRDIFIRELISNASDALDKIRLLALKAPEMLGEGSAANLEIRMEVDTEKGILKIRDRGVGMSKQELINNLGTIAKSGTSAFLEAMQNQADPNLIGQFGVGFYSVYLVSNYVEVISRAHGEKQHIWESTAGGNFVITEDEGGAVSGEGDLERGTLIRIHLNEENDEYAEADKLRELVKRYSEFINFPIYLLSSKEVEVEQEDEAADESAEDGIKDEDDEEAKEDKDEKEKVMQTVWEWDLINRHKAIWLRNPGDVEEEEYNKFYEALSKEEGTKPLSHVHFKAEGDVEFRAILYVPNKAPWNFYDTYFQRKPSIRLYVRRVFISDEFEDLLPRYLGFLLGLVDSDTLPLSVSRETLQQHSALKTIKKKLVRKSIEIVKDLATGEAKARKALREHEEKGGEAAEDEDEEDEGPFDEEALKKDVKRYEKFWKEFGKAIKLGVIDDPTNRNRLVKLLRFKTTRSQHVLTSMDEYVERMKGHQKQIYYLCGPSMEEVLRSPFLERLEEADFEVILLTEPMDEYMMQNILDYDDLKLQDVTKEDMKLSDNEDDEKRKKQQKKRFKPLTKWWKKLLEEQGLESVKLSDRLSATPCIIVTSKHSVSAHMQRIMQAQALGDAQRQQFLHGKRTMEINPQHPLVVGLLETIVNDEEDESAKDTAKLLYEAALMEGGYPLLDQAKFAARIYDLVKAQLGVQRDLSDLHPVPEIDPDMDTTPEEDDEDHPSKANHGFGPNVKMTDVTIDDSMETLPDEVPDEL